MEVQHEFELGHLLSKVREYREGKTDLDDLQKTLWGTAQALTNYEARRLRQELQDAEGRLESIRFTVDTDRVGGEVLRLLDDVEAKVKRLIGEEA
jgi:hypothetical protein